MDSDIDELRELVKKNIKLTEENNKILHGMRRAARWGRFFSILWWIIVVAVSGAAYYVYVQPYVQKVQDAYNNGKTLEQQFGDYLHQFGNTTGQ